VFLNVIIPSYRAKATIGQAVQSVRANRAFGGGFDITVVDSSDDETADVALAQDAQVNVIRLPERAYPGAARNRGVEATKGDVLCFIDADARAEAGWLGAIHDYLEKHADVAAVGGPVLNANPDEGWSRLAHWCEFSGYGPNAPEGPRRVQPTVNLAMRRSAFERCGPFLEHQFGNEDVLLVQNIRKAGEQLHFTRTMRVYHRNKTTLEAIVQHQRLLGECTGRAAVLYDVPGAILARPGGSTLVPFIKTQFICWRLFSQEPNEFPSFLLHWPRVFVAMIGFARGFEEGVRDARRQAE
jgi:glycosyltransferase involved in cell wall biosynthesis